jgi:ABC-type Fe3+-siderophore transport system permease subunit
MAVKIVAALLGFISGVLVYPWFNQYVIALFAFFGAVAVAVIVYLIACNVISSLIGESRSL